MSRFADAVADKPNFIFLVLYFSPVRPKNQETILVSCGVLHAPLQHICATSIILILIPALASVLDQLTSDPQHTQTQTCCVCSKGMDPGMI